MPKGHTDDFKIRPAEYEHPGRSLGTVRMLFLNLVRHDAPQVLEGLRALDGSEQALLAWATHWHLNEPWIMDVARRAREDWRRYPDQAERLMWASVMVIGEWVPQPPPIRWEITLETEREFKERVKAYVVSVREWAESIGLEQTWQKPNLPRDLKALVQYQVKGDDWVTVADKRFGSDPSTARKALKGMADFIGLTLRK